MQNQQIREYLAVYYSHRIPRAIQNLMRKFDQKSILEIEAFQQILQAVTLHRENRNITTDHSDVHQTLMTSLCRLPPLYSFVLMAKYRWEWSDEKISELANETTSRIQFIHQIAIEELLERADTELISSQEELVAILQSLPLNKDSAHLHRTSHSLTSPKKWTNFRTKWFVRLFTESTLILGILVLIFWVIPEMRATYDRLVIKKVNSYLLEDVLTSAPVPPGMEVKTPSNIPQPTAETNPAEEQPVNLSPEKSKPPKVSAGELWRFSFTGSDATRIQEMIDQSLTSAINEKQKASSVPGGIQYEFDIPTNSLAPLKIAFETGLLKLRNELSREAQSASGDTGASVHLSWYKRPYQGDKKPGAGKIRVVVWISTL